MREEIYALAARLAGVREEEREWLEAFCAGAEAFWKGRLRGGAEGGEALVCAAALRAAADLADLREREGVASFSAGDLSVTLRDSAAGEALRRAAEGLMAPFAAPEGVWLRGVRS